MSARTDLWEPWVSNHPGPPGPLAPLVFFILHFPTLDERGITVASTSHLCSLLTALEMIISRLCAKLRQSQTVFQPDFG